MRSTVLWFTLTLGVSAFLLLWVQPLFGRWVLPRYGGSPSVWMSCLVFFQGVLLAGYAYAYVLTRAVTVRWQFVVHLAVLAAGAMTFPLKPVGSEPLDGARPILSLLLDLTLGAGLPYFALSATAPLFQTWFLRATGGSVDPYPLYSASNAGSLLGVVGYPLLIEPAFELTTQSWAWAGGYAAFVLLALGCVRLASRGGDPKPAAAESADRPSIDRRLRWIALAAVPSSLLSGTTHHITVDLTPIPLLWLLPLGLYLATFVLAFSHWGDRLRGVIRWTMPLVLLFGFVGLFPTFLIVKNVFVLTAFAVVALGAVALGCHSELAADRPQVGRLTEFYLLMSVGGVVGSAFNTFLAPVLFSTALEYPLAMLAATVLLPPRRVAGGWRAVLSDVGLGFGLVVACFTVSYVVVGTPGEMAFGLLPVLACFAAWVWPIRLWPLFTVTLTFAYLMARGDNQPIDTERTFYGILTVTRVQTTDKQWFHQLNHGTTNHGRQVFGEPARISSVPLTYYFPAGPAGQMFEAVRRRGSTAPVAVVGLGTGAMAGYGRPGQTVDFYELDSAVERIARDPRLFTYLSDAKADTRVILGDARLKLAEAADGTYGVLAVDAFSSDAIPIHLLTREAFELYMRKLRPDGLLAFHISNRYLDLEPVVANLAADHPDGLICMSQYDLVADATEFGRHRFTAHWLVVARSREALGVIAENPAWQPARTDARVGLWTDQYSNILRVFKRLK